MGKYELEHAELDVDGQTPLLYVQCYEGHTATYFLKEVLNFLKKQELIKSFNVFEYQGFVEGEVDIIHKLNIGYDSEKTYLETVPIEEYIDENYKDIEYFLQNRLS